MRVQSDVRERRIHWVGVELGLKAAPLASWSRGLGVGGNGQPAHCFTLIDIAILRWQTDNGADESIRSLDMTQAYVQLCRRPVNRGCYCCWVYAGGLYVSALTRSMDKFVGYCEFLTEEQPKRTGQRITEGSIHFVMALWQCYDPAW